MLWPPRALLIAVTASLAFAACGSDSGNTTSPSTDTTQVTTSSSAEPTTTTTNTSTTLVATTTTLEVEDVDALLVVGDWGSGTLPQGAVAGAMMRYTEANEVEAILTTGDNLYSDDTEFLLHPFSWAIEAEIPFWITWGNHDVESEDRIEAMEEAFDDPPRWSGHRWGDVDVVILDSTQIGSEEQLQFLTDTLAASDRATIVAVHHPPYSCGFHDDSENVQNTLLPRFDDDVFLVLSGHEHNYQRFQEGDITYVVTGGGGATLTDLDTCSGDPPERSSGESTHHFMALQQGDDLTVRAYDVSGEIIEEFGLAIP